jgi:hypothetical protein
MRPPPSQKQQPQSGAPVVQVIRVSGGAGARVVGFLVFLLVLGAAGVFVAYRLKENSKAPQEIAAAGDSDFRAATSAEAGIPAIIYDPETDGERSPPDYTEDTSVAESLAALNKLDDEINREPPKAALAASAAANAALKAPSAKPDDEGLGLEGSPKIVRKTIRNPNLSAKDKFALKKLPPERIVDVLIVYTVTAKFGFGGPRGMLARANWFVAGANAYYASHKVNGMLRLVGFVQADYVDNDTRADLHNISRGVVRCGRDSIEDLRRRTGADIVCLIGTRGGGGLAYMPGQFCVVKKGRGPGVFTHEMQHTFGWKHNHGENLWQVEAAFPRSAGHRQTVIPQGELYIQYRDSRGTKNKL